MEGGRQVFFVVREIAIGGEDDATCAARDRADQEVGRRSLNALSAAAVGRCSVTLVAESLQFGEEG